MNKVLAVFFVLMLVCIVTSNTFGQAASARATRAEQSGDTEAVQQVLAVDAARRLAMLHSDVRTLDSLLAEDATIFWATALRTTRPPRSRCSARDVSDTRSWITKTLRSGYTAKPPW